MQGLTTHFECVQCPAKMNRVVTPFIAHTQKWLLLYQRIGLVHKRADKFTKG
jgi:hypothetical protein